MARSTSSFEKSEQLLHTGSAYRKLLETFSEPVIFRDGDKIVFINRAGLRMLGASSLRQVVGKPEHLFFGKGFRDVLHARWRKMSRNFQPAPATEQQIQQLDGGVRMVQFTSFPFLEDGKLLIQQLFHDITEQKKTEQKIRESEQRYRIFIEQAADGIYLVDSKANFLLVNKQFCAMLGYSQEELYKMSAFATYLPSEIPTGKQRLAQVNAGEPVRFERHVLRKDGSVFTAEVSGRRLPDGTLQATMRDITERKRAETFKETLVASVVHQFATPITSILGFADLLTDGKYGELSPRQQEAVNLIMSDSRRLRELIQRFLNIAKIRRTGVVVNRTLVSLPQIIHNEVNRQEEVARGKGLLVTLNLASLPPIRVDESLMTDVISNLLNNAIKYNVQGGSITITARRKAGSVAVEFKDTGIGIAPDVLSELFTEFFRVQEQTGIGTGLGLYTCKIIVDAHGGTIHAASKGLGKGSTFTFTLPTKTPKKHA